jgi:prepilin-type N-terminal cleavage/methylation domain-containing protein
MNDFRFSIWDFGLRRCSVGNALRGVPRESLPPGEGWGEGGLKRMAFGTQCRAEGAQSKLWTLGFGLWTCASNPKSKIQNPKSRRGFTLIELLVTITIIGILAALALGGMYRANVAARQTNTKTTVNKVAVQLNEVWESYRTRKLPINPQLVLQSGGNAPYTYQFANATAWLTYFQSIRTSPTYNIPSANLTYVAGMAPNNLQIAAVRLAATRELMRLELPCRFSDFTSSKVGTTPANAAPVQTLLIPQPMNGTAPLANPGGLSEQYRQFFMANATTFNQVYESAECLYMIIKFASQNELGQRSITDDPRLVGDVDGDGMPEIQDAFASGTFTAPPPGSPITQHNMPIKFIRWPAGFLSDLQPGPTPAQYNSSNPTAEYAASRHDIFDPLRIDPRAFTLTPLVYSAGPNGTSGVIPGVFDAYDVWETTDFGTQSQPFLPPCDPYYTDNTPAKPSAIFPIVPNVNDLNPGIQYPLPGAVMDLNTQWPNSNGYLGKGAYPDNITNHVLNTRTQ